MARSSPASGPPANAAGTDGAGSPWSLCRGGEVTRDPVGGGLCPWCHHQDVLNAGHVLLGPGDYVGVAVG